MTEPEHGVEPMLGEAAAPEPDYDDHHRAVQLKVDRVAKGNAAGGTQLPNDAYHPSFFDDGELAATTAIAAAAADSPDALAAPPAGSDAAVTAASAAETAAATATQPKQLQQRRAGGPIRTNANNTARQRRPDQVDRRTTEYYKQYDEVVQCDVCKERVTGTTALRRHFKVAHGSKKYQCRKCGDLFSSVAERQTHKNNIHFTEIETEVQSQEFGDYAPTATVRASRNNSGYFNCPMAYCSFETRIPGYWYEHVHKVPHKGEDPQRKAKKDEDDDEPKDAAAASAQA